MNQEQYLLVKLAEESSEISQIALKTTQFGLDSFYEPIFRTNQERINDELNDLTAVVELLNEHYGLSFTQDRTAIENKKLKMKKFLLESISLNKVKDEGILTSNNVE